MGDPLFGMTLMSSWEQPQLRDVIMFGALVAAGAMRSDYPAAKRRRERALGMWMATLRGIVAPMYDNYIQRLYPMLHDATLPPPVITYRRAGVRPKVCEVDPETAWSFIARAEESHIHNIHTIIASKNDEHRYEALSPQNGVQWQKREVFIYLKKQLPLFTGAKQVCTVADPSCYSGEDSNV